MAALADRVGRRRVIVWSVLTAAALGLLLPLAPTCETLIAARALQGVATAGVPATAMAFLAQETGKAHVGAAIGALVAGNSAGGMLGRLITGFTTDGTSWRTALALAGAFGAACAITAALLLPPGHRAERRPSALKDALTDRVLLCQYAIAILAVAAFISVFNVIGFRLTTDLGLPTAVATLRLPGLRGGRRHVRRRGPPRRPPRPRPHHPRGSGTGRRGCRDHPSRPRRRDRRRPHPVHRRLLRRPRGRQRLGRRTRPRSRPRPGGRRLPVRLLRRQQHRRHGGQRRLPSPRLARLDRADHRVAGPGGTRRPRRGQGPAVRRPAGTHPADDRVRRGHGACRRHSRAANHREGRAVMSPALPAEGRGQKSSGTSTPGPPATGTGPNWGNVTVPAATDNVADRTSSGTSNTAATGNVSPP